MKKFGIILFLVTSTLFATTKCYDFDDYINYSNDLVEIKKLLNKLRNKTNMTAASQKEVRAPFFIWGQV